MEEKNKKYYKFHDEEVAEIMKQTNKSAIYMDDVQIQIYLLLTFINILKICALEHQQIKRI